MAHEISERRFMIQRHISSWIVAVGLLFCSDMVQAQGPDIDISGSIKSYFIAVDQPQVFGELQGDDGIDWTVQNQLRLQFVWNLTDLVRGEMAYDLLPMVQSDDVVFSQSMGLNFEPISYRVTDLDRRIYPDDDDGDFILAQNLDRLFLTFSYDFADIHLGRQPIAFGSALVINPTDVIAPYSFDELNTEDRIGVDAIRAQVPIGALGEFDAGILFGKNFEIEESAAFIRTKFYALNTDFTLLVLDFKENLLLGVDISRSIGGAGFWIEAAHTFAGVFNSRESNQDFFRFSTGLDYNFNISNGLLAYIEYHYNGASEGKKEEYLTQTDQTAFQDAGVFLLGRHYLTPGFTWMIQPLLTFDSSLLWNMEDSSVYLSVKIEYNLSENIYIGLGANIAAGEGPKLADKADLSVETIGPESEFGLYPSLYYGYIRYYF